MSSKPKEIELEGGKRTKARQSFLLDSSTNPLAMASCELLEQRLGREACSLEDAKKSGLQVDEGHVNLVKGASSGD